MVKAKEAVETKEKKPKTIADIAKAYNLRYVREYESVDRLPSGSLQLDRIMGGGWAVGRIQELWGPPSYGKSLLTMMTIGRTLFLKKKAILYDLENSFDPAWAKFFLDPDDDNLIVLQKEEDTIGEAILNSIIEYAHDPTVGFIALDSKDAIVFGAELEGGVGPKNMGLRAALLGNFVRILQQVIENSQVTFLFISEVRANYKGDGYITSGGYSLEHKCSIQVQLYAPKPLTVKVDGKDVVVGTGINVTCNKNKTAKAKMSEMVEVREFKTQDGVEIHMIDTASEVFKLGTEQGLFTLADGKPYEGSGNAHYNGESLGSKNVALAKLRTEPVLCFDIEKAIRAKLGWQ